MSNDTTKAAEDTASVMRSLRIPLDLAKRIDRACKRLGMTRTAFILQALLRAVRRTESRAA